MHVRVSDVSLVLCVLGVSGYLGVSLVCLSFVLCVCRSALGVSVAFRVWLSFCLGVCFLHTGHVSMCWMTMCVLLCWDSLSSWGVSLFLG